MNEPDELFTLRTLFWIGNFQGAISEANGLNKIPAALKGEKAEYVYRSYIGLGQHHIVMGEVKDDPHVSVGLRAIKLLATLLEDPSSKEIVVLQIKEWMNDPIASGNTTLQTMAAMIYIHDDNVKEAFKAIKNGINMEQYALLVQMYLRIDRIDLAQKQLKQMKSIEDDSVLVAIANATINLNLGGAAKIQEAAFAYEEMIDKYSGSSLLYNGFAVAKMQLGQFEEAESTLLESLGKAPSDADTLANLITVSYHMQKPDEVVNRYISQLRSQAPLHPLVAAMNTFNSAFDRVSTTLK